MHGGPDNGHRRSFQLSRSNRDESVAGGGSVRLGVSGHPLRTALVADGGRVVCGAIARQKAVALT